MRCEIRRITTAISEKNIPHDRMRLPAIARERCEHPLDAARSFPLEESLREKKTFFLETPLGNVTSLLAEHFSLKERVRPSCGYPHIRLRSHRVARDLRNHDPVPDPYR